jgi:hypothetical protein
VRSDIQVWISGVLTSTYDAATRNGRAGYTPGIAKTYTAQTTATIVSTTNP